MIQKKYKIETKYGVVVNQLKNVIVVGTTKPEHHDTVYQVNEKIKNENLPVQKGEPIHTLINNLDHYKQYIADNNLTIDPNQTLEALKVAAIEFFAKPEWTVGIAVTTGQHYRYENVLYEVIQPHTTQSDWTPDSTPALFKVYTQEELIADWVQPAGSHDAYNTGDKVKFEGDTWVSLIDANVWSPTGYPAGWNKII